MEKSTHKTKPKEIDPTNKTILNKAYKRTWRYKNTN